MDLKLPSEFLPTTNELIRLDNGNSLVIPKASPIFKAWSGQVVADTFGGKTVLEDSAEPCFAELLILRHFLRAGWSGRWVETYGAAAMKPRLLSRWSFKTLKLQEHEPIMEEDVSRALDSIARKNGNSYSGCWDVVVWNNGKPLFVESKLKGHDRLRKTQLRWIHSALEAGFSTSDFLIIEWSVT